MASGPRSKTLPWLLLAACEAGVVGGAGGDGVPDPTDGAPTPRCGDGNLDAGELCDDDNTDDGDGCDRQCRREGYYLHGGWVLRALSADQPETGLAVVVVGTRIENIEPVGALPSDLTPIDLTGMTLLPGLIDAHTHLAVRPATYTGALADCLDAGVTTVQDVGSRLTEILALRESVSSGAVEGPRLLVAGPMFSAPGGHPVATYADLEASATMREVDDVTEARTAVQALAAARVDSIKAILTDCGGSCPRLDPSVLDAIIDEAHTQGLLVTVHTDTRSDVNEALAAGADSLEHGLTLEAPTNPVLDAMETAGVTVVGTLAIIEAMQPAALDLVVARVGGLRSAGIPMVPGSDTATGMAFGAPLVRELELWVARLGATPVEAVVAATRDAARHVGLAGSLGTLEAGKRADLLVVLGDVSTDISAVRDVRWVFLGGRVVRQP